MATPVLLFQMSTLVISTCLTFLTLNFVLLSNGDICDMGEETGSSVFSVKINKLQRTR